MKNNYFVSTLILVLINGAGCSLSGGLSKSLSEPSDNDLINAAINGVGVKANNEIFHSLVTATGVNPTTLRGANGGFGGYNATVTQLPASNDIRKINKATITATFLNATNACKIALFDGVSTKNLRALFVANTSPAVDCGSANISNLNNSNNRETVIDNAYNALLGRAPSNYEISSADQLINDLLADQTTDEARKICTAVCAVILSTPEFMAN